MTDSKKGTGSKKKKSGQLRKVQSARTGRPTAPGKAADQSRSGKGVKSAAPESFFAKYKDEISLLITLVFAVILLLSNFHLCGPAGDVINYYSFGLFGFMAFVLPILLFFGVAFYISNRENRGFVRKLLCAVFVFFDLAGLLELFNYGNVAGSDAAKIFVSCAEGKNGGGLVAGYFVKLLCMALDTVGSYIVLIALMIILMMFLTERFFFKSIGRRAKDAMATAKERRELERAESEREERYVQRSIDDGEPLYERQKLKRKPRSYTFPKEDFAADTEMSEIKPASESELYDVPGAGKNETVTPVRPEPEFTIHRSDASYVDNEDETTDFDNFKADVKGMFDEEKTDNVVPFYEKELKNKFGDKNKDVAAFDNEFTSADDFKDDFSGPKFADGLSENDAILAAKTVTDGKPLGSWGAKEGLSERSENVAGHNVSGRISSDPDVNSETAKEMEAAIEQTRIPYTFPPVSLLSRPSAPQKGTSDKELKETAITLQKTLESFGVNVTVTNVSCGPTVTRYELQPERGVKVSRITGLADDIKLNLAASEIRIEAPIPGKAAVGIEVPNKTNSTVFFRELIESKEFKESKSAISFAVGKDIGGQVVVSDIAKMPHLLIAGATGSGKSVCINTLIMSIIYKADPNDVKLIMVDPKVVELSVYNGIPHLLIPVVTDPKKASGALAWAVAEMTDRYQKFAELGVRDIKGYNERIEGAKDLPPDARYVKMPQIVIIVDELADLMMVAPGEVEDSICRLAQLARAAGIHLVIATQRPSVNVITGLIKANVPSRIAFSVSSQIDSRTILDGAGAEKLLGKGDMLFAPYGSSKPTRVQGAFVSDGDVTKVVEFLTKQYEGTDSIYSSDIAEKIDKAQPAGGKAGSGAGADDEGAGGDVDEYFAEAGRFIIEKEKASIGMLQRVYKIGFNRAARIMDQLCEAGVVGPEQGTKPREILMTLEDFDNYLEMH